MNGDIAYEYPVFIFLAVGVAVGFFLLLMRLVAKPEKDATWKCLLCGAAFKGKNENNYKYCPFCGTKRGTRIGPGKNHQAINFDESEEEDYSDIDEELLN